jgi:hypothetical protein
MFLHPYSPSNATNTGSFLPPAVAWLLWNKTGPQLRVPSIPTDWPHFLSYACARSRVSLRDLPTLWVQHCTGSFISHSSINICESSVWDMFHSILLTHETLKCLPDFENLYTPKLSHPILNIANKWYKSLNHFCICMSIHDFLFQTPWVHVSIQGQQPHHLWEQNMKHHHYCFVASLIHEKTFNRVYEVLHHRGFLFPKHQTLWHSYDASQVR